MHVGLQRVGALSRWRGAGAVPRAGGEGQAKVWRWDLVAETEDAPGKEGELMQTTPPFATEQWVLSSAF